MTDNLGTSGLDLFGGEGRDRRAKDPVARRSQGSSVAPGLRKPVTPPVRLAL
jgi:hypothetical protein